MKKRSYLYRVVVIIIGLLFFVILFFNYFWDKSFEEMKKSNEIYYENLVVNFSNDFYEKIENIKKHVSTLVVESKDTKSILWNGGELLKNEYWRYEVLNNAASNSYYEFGDMRCGIYYYDLDLLLFRGATMSSEQFLRVALNVYEDKYEKIDCFDLKNFEADRIMFASTGNSSQSKLFVGYCTTFGKNRDKVMVFCLMESSDFGGVEKYVNGYDDVNFYVLNKNTREVYLNIGENSNNYNGIDWENAVLGDKMQIFKSVYMKSDYYLPLSFALSISEDSLQNNIVDFYHNMRAIIVVVAVVLLLICAVSIYIVYKPVHQLTYEVEESDIGEIESIRNALNDRKGKILEQEMLILDLLLSHLIYGVPLSTEKIVHLGIKKEMRHYCVILGSGVSLLNSQMQQLSNDIEHVFPVKLFIKEWGDENGSIMIFFMKDKENHGLENYIKERLKNYLAEPFDLCVGNVVDNVDDIRSSFLSCLKKYEKNTSDMKEISNKVKTLKAQNEQQKKLKDDILAYVETHYRDRDMSQTKVADSFRISNYTLSRLFKNQVGVGFTDYVNSKRLELAKELLLTTPYSVREVSLMVGFSSDNYFYRMFKASTGVSPSEFRGK